MHGNVNHLLSGCGDTGEWKEKKISMRKYKKQPPREPEHEKATATGRLKRERKFVFECVCVCTLRGRETHRETDNDTLTQWKDTACEGLPTVHSGTWNYSTRKRLGWLLTEASALADFPVRKMLHPIGCSETVPWQTHPSYMREAIVPLSSIMSYSPLTPRLKHSGVTAVQMSLGRHWNVWLRTRGCGADE